MSGQNCVGEEIQQAGLSATMQAMDMAVFNLLAEKSSKTAVTDSCG